MTAKRPRGESGEGGGGARSATSDSFFTDILLALDGGDGSIEYVQINHVSAGMYLASVQRRGEHWPDSRHVFLPGVGEPPGARPPFGGNQGDR